MTDTAHIATWLHGRPPTTRREYSREMAKLQAQLDGRPLISATLTDLQAHLDTIAALAPRSRGRAVATLRSFYKFHVKVGTILHSPAEALSAPKTPQGLAPRILTEAEVDQLIRGGETYHDALALMLLYVGGVRASEFCGLRWKHLTADNRLTIANGKGGKSRVIGLPASVGNDLRTVRPARALDTDLMFPIGTRQLNRIVKRAAVNAKLTDKVSPHWLRHSCLSHALDNGASISLVRDHAGHSSIAVTNNYLHAKEGDSASNYLRMGGK